MNIASTYEALLDQFKEISKDPKPAALEWQQKTGGKIAGISGLDVPEPILHAAGILPIVLLEKEDEPITAANAHVETHQCGYIRSVVNQALLGEYDYMDFLLFHDCCHIERMTGDALPMYSEGKIKVEYIYLPPNVEYDTTKKYVEKEYRKLIARMEAISGNTVTEEKLQESIHLFNRQRELLIHLYDLRRAYPGIMRAAQVSDVVAAGMVMPKEDHVEMLEKLIGFLEEKKGSLPVSDKVPVVVHGSLCERCDEYVLNTIEEAGGVVVDDDLYVGARYFATLYDESLPAVDALTKAYQYRAIPCPTRYEANRGYGESFMELVQKAGAKAAVMVVVKFCEPHYYAYFSMFHKMREEKFPNILVETEHENAQPEQLKTRLQAIFEGLEV